MIRPTTAIASLLVLLFAARAQAQAPAEPPPLWDWQVGASFVGTSGNTDTGTVGADFAYHGRWPVWKIESTATAIHATDTGRTTAERYLAALRGSRTLTSLLSFTGGEKIERDQFAGIDLRNVLDAGLGWALVRTPGWTLDGVTSIAWLHESQVGGIDIDHPTGVLQALSRIPFGSSGDTTQRFTYYPDFSESTSYRSEAEITAQAAMNARLALKFGYLWRFANAPAPGFKKIDNTTTASVVLRWKAATPAAP
jgi:putative salt-induced outer membrane protein YdiY